MQSTIELFVILLLVESGIMAIVLGPVAKHIRKNREKLLVKHTNFPECQSRGVRPHPEIPNAFYIGGLLVIRD